MIAISTHMNVCSKNVSSFSHFLEIPLRTFGVLGPFGLLGMALTIGCVCCLCIIWYRRRIDGEHRPIVNHPPPGPWWCRQPTCHFCWFIFIYYFMYFIVSVWGFVHIYMNSAMPGIMERTCTSTITVCTPGVQVDLDMHTAAHCLHLGPLLFVVIFLASCCTVQLAVCTCMWRLSDVCRHRDFPYFHFQAQSSYGQAKGHDCLVHGGGMGVPIDLSCWIDVRRY